MSLTRIGCAFILGCYLLLGCATNVVVKDVNTPDPDGAWARVLLKFVDDSGKVNFVGLSKDMNDLDSYVSYIAKVSPKSHPTQFSDANSHLAHYLNSYNALAMYNVIRFDIPEDNASFFKRLKFFYRTKFPIGGEYSSLYSYENDVIRPLGDPRVHIALNCMVRGCPRLPRTPFVGKILQNQLEALAVEFFNEKRNVRVDNQNKVVHLSEILKFFTEDFLKVSPTLITYVNKYAKEKIPDTYQVEFIDYDWTTNSQPPPKVS